MCYGRCSSSTLPPPQRLTQRALQLVDEAIVHTPTLVELYNAKAKILKHAGDPEAAAHLAEAARRFDLSDRYLNRWGTWGVSIRVRHMVTWGGWRGDSGTCGWGTFGGVFSGPDSTRLAWFFTVTGPLCSLNSPPPPVQRCGQGAVRSQSPRGGEC